MSEELYLSTDPNWTPKIHLKLVLGLLISSPFNLAIESIPSIVNDHITTAKVDFDFLKYSSDMVI